MPYNKYYKQKKQVSYDEGQTWEDVIPYEYQKGTLYEVDSPDCRYLPEIKFILTYSDGSTFTKYCNEYSYISGSEVMEGGQKSEITEIFIGSCVRGISVNAFNGVCKLKRVNSNVDGVMNIPEGVLEIEENAFTWTCSSCHITSITLPSTLQRLSLDAFDSDYCHQTLTINAVTPPYMYLDEYDYFPKPIYVPCQSVSAYKSASGWSTFKDYIYGIPPCAQPKFQATYSGGQTYERECDGNTTLTKGDTNPSGYEYSAMTSAIIGECVRNIDDYAFYMCYGLASVAIPNSVTSIGNSAFIVCYSLTSITIPNSVTSIGDAAFADCTGLTSVTLPNSITRIGDTVFSLCSSLTGITIPNSVTSIGDNAFSNCSGLTNVTIPNSVTSIGYQTFAFCSGLTSITIPNSVTTIDENAFAYSSSLTGITIPTGVTSISNGIFQYCTSLSSVTIPTGVTSIGEFAFSDCSGLTSVTIPDSVTSVGRSAFIRCSGLTSVTCLATTPPTIGIIVFDNTNNCPIYVPAQSVENYKSASGWSQYSDRIFPIT